MSLAQFDGTFNTFRKCTKDENAILSSASNGHIEDDKIGQRKCLGLKGCYNEHSLVNVIPIADLFKVPIVRIKFVSINNSSINTHIEGK